MTEQRSWSLPFAERYRAIRRDLEVLPSEIDRCHRRAAQYADDARAAELRLAAAERAWARMERECADEIASYEAHIEAVRARLNAAGWKV